MEPQRRNEAFGNDTSVLGGNQNIAGDGDLLTHTLGWAATVSGGYNNTAAGNNSSVGGGQNREAADASDWVGGSLTEDY